MEEKTYGIAVIKYDVLREGTRLGSANVFVDFSDDAAHVELMTAKQIFDAAAEAGDGCQSVIFIGDTKNLDTFALNPFAHASWFTAIVADGTFKVDPRIHWITIKPSVMPAELKQKEASEVIYVIDEDTFPPDQPNIESNFFCVCPDYKLFKINYLKFSRNLDWCIYFIKQNPKYKLSIELHG